MPAANRCVLFETSKDSWHGLSRIRLPAERSGISRRSIAVYFYTRERPAAETAANHATVYVQRPLPAHIAPGHTLSEADVREICDLLSRRDEQHRFLHERELRFTALLENIVHSPVYRLAAAVTWPAEKTQAVDPAHVDQWRRAPAWAFSSRPTSQKSIIDSLVQAKHDIEP